MTPAWMGEVTHAPERCCWYHSLHATSESAAEAATAVAERAGLARLVGWWQGIGARPMSTEPRPEPLKTGNADQQ